MNAIYKVRYLGATDEQVAFGGHDDPRGVLTIGRVYKLDRREEDVDWTTYIINSRRYNSVCFAVVSVVRKCNKEQ